MGIGTPHFLPFDLAAAMHPTPQEALIRLQVVLGLMSHLGAQEDPEGPPSDPFATRAELKSRGYWDHASPWEQEMLGRGKGEYTKLELINLSWKPESVHVLAWALQYLPALAPWDEVAPIEPMLSLNPDMLANPDLQPVLLATEELEAAREIAERWHWRARIRDLEEKGQQPAQGGSFAELVQETANKLAAAGAFTPLDGDFPVQGHPYRSTPKELIWDLTAAAMERHRTLNWLCGYAPGNRWGDTPTEA